MSNPFYFEAPLEERSAEYMSTHYEVCIYEDGYKEGWKNCAGLNIQYGFGMQDFLFQEKIDGQMVTMFKGSWKDLYHLLREQYGKEDKQLTLW